FLLLFSHSVSCFVFPDFYYFLFFFFFHVPATPAIYTLSLHDALPIFTRALSPALSYSGVRERLSVCVSGSSHGEPKWSGHGQSRDRKSTRLNSSHGSISYAVFCLKKKKKRIKNKRINRKSTKIEHRLS